MSREGLGCCNCVLYDALGGSVLFKGYQEMNKIFRVMEYCYPTVLYLSSAVIALNWPFPSQIASHQFTYPISILPYIHSCRKTESFALVTVILLAAHHHQNCHYCSVFLAWNEGGTFPQSITEREQGMAKRGNCAYSEK